MGVYSGGLTFGPRIFASEIWEAYFLRARCRRGLLFEFYGTFSGWHSVDSGCLLDHVYSKTKFLNLVIQTLILK